MVARRARGRLSPQPLQVLAARASLHLLESACKSPHNLLCTESLRKECVASLPCVLRQQLVEELLRSGRVYNTLQLCVLDVLLTEDIRRLAVRHVRRFYRGPFVALLCSGRARGLEVLLFEDMTWLTGDPRASRPLASALSALPGLGRVSLRFVCDDVVLAALGAHCPGLRELDVSGALGVSDAGLQGLCLRGKGSGPWRRLLPDCLMRCPPVRRHSKRNACCESLILVNLTATGVTGRGLDFLRGFLPNARVLTKLWSRSSPS